MFHKLPKVDLFYTTLLAALMAGLANLLLFYFLLLLGIKISVPTTTSPDSLAPLTLGRILLASIAPALVAGIFFAFARKLSPRSVRSFFVISLGLLIFSFGAPLDLPIENSAKIGLILMHMVAALFILGTLYNFNKQAK